MARHYYAAQNPYGNRAISTGDRLIRFSSEANRDAFVTADEGHREALTLREAARKFDTRPHMFEPDEVGGAVVESTGYRRSYRAALGWS